jgi:small subunit ribosomal protein S6
LGTIGKRVYEALFLVDTAMAAADWDGTLKVIETVLSRGEAEIISMRKWDERKLAYDIDGKGRGTYILAYFRMDTSKVTVVERAIRLSEKIMRVMILRTDRMTQADMDKPTPIVLAEIQPAGAEGATGIQPAAPSAPSAPSVN